MVGGVSKTCHRVALCLLAIALAAGVGCSWKGGPSTRADDSGSEVWSPQPVQMRVYPSSRFAAAPDGSPVLEARIELLDSMGDSTKAAGEYRVELLRSAEEGMGERLYAWDVLVQNQAQQARHYDKVTRTYLFRLKLDDAGPPQHPTSIRVTFTPLSGASRLSATLALR
jgi:hypothetical protein